MYRFTVVIDNVGGDHVAQNLMSMLPTDQRWFLAQEEIQSDVQTELENTLTPDAIRCKVYAHDENSLNVLTMLSPDFED